MDEGKRFAAALEKLAGRRGKPERVFERVRWATMFRLMLSLALLKGEVLGLRLQDLDLSAETPMLHVRQAPQAVGAQTIVGALKTESAPRSLPLSAPIVKALNRYLELRKAAARDEHWEEMGILFTTKVATPIYPRNVKRALDPIPKGAGIPHLRVHDLRHSAATFAAAERVPANYLQRMLGHSDPRTTMAI